MNLVPKGQEKDYHKKCKNWQNKCHLPTILPYQVKVQNGRLLTGLGCQPNIEYGRRHNPS